MPSIFIKEKTAHDIGPGETHLRKWNNASPGKAVWSANAMPVATGSTNTGFAEEAQLEVTRFWRKLVVVEKKPYPQSQTADVTIEDELWCEIKNLGNKKARYVVCWAGVY